MNEFIKLYASDRIIKLVTEDIDKAILKLSKDIWLGLIEDESIKFNQLLSKDYE